MREGVALALSVGVLRGCITSNTPNKLNNDITVILIALLFGIDTEYCRTFESAVWYNGLMLLLAAEVSLK